MTFKVSNNQYDRPHPSDSWASCFLCTTTGNRINPIILRELSENKKNVLELNKNYNKN